MVRSFTRALSFAAVALYGGMCHAQVTSITSSGLSTAVDANYNITGGTRSGANLFHSFGSFSVVQPDVANFVNETLAPTANIIGRVTGGQASNIFGTIKTTEFGTANLFLINPAGWVFGAGASVEVGGSFHASTADYIRFSDAENSQFFADPTRTSGFSSAPPAAFGFLPQSERSLPFPNSPASPILVDQAFLSVAEGQTLSLIGGDVTVTSGSVLFAPSGRVQIGSFTSAGEAAVEGLTGVFEGLGRVEISGGSVISVADIDAIDFDTGVQTMVNGGSVFVRGGQVDILGFSLIDVSGTQFFDADFNIVGTAGGTVVIRGGRLFIESSVVISNTYGDVDGGPIDLALAESITVTNPNGPESASAIITTGSADFGFGSGHGGDIQIKAPTVNVHGSVIVAGTNGESTAGSVILTADTLAMTGGSGIGSLGGEVRVTANQSASISGRNSDGSPTSLFTSTANSRDAGQLTVSTPSLTMQDFGTITSTTLGGAGGEIVLSVNRLSITGGANIDSHTGGTSSGGNVTVTATESALLVGVGTDGSPSGIFSDSCGGCTGRAGDITVTAGNLALTDGAQIQSGSALDPQGGSVTIRATDSLVISNRSGISAQADSQPVGQVSISAGTLRLDDGFISASTLGSARAGDIVVNAQSVVLARGGQITSSSELSASGSGGNIVVTANSVSVSGTSPSGDPSSPFSTIPNSGIFSTTRSSAGAGEIGAAGQITVTAPSVILSDRGTVSVATFGGGDGGQAFLNVGNLTVSDGARIDSSTTGTGLGGGITVNGSGSVLISGAGSGLFSTASSTGDAGEVSVSASIVNVTGSGTIDSSTSGAGAGGAISVNATQVNMDGGSIRADSLASGVTGDITIIAGDRILMNAGSISTLAETSDGGNITLIAPNIIRLEDSQITTSVESGSGGGGNIFIDPQFVILNGSSITANAFGGPGGNISIVANNFLTDPSSSVTASSALSTPGTVQIQSPENNVAGDIAQLPSAPIDASRLMAGACSARRAGAPSSFQVAGRGGVPADPDGYLPTSGISGAPFAPRTAQTSGFALLAMSGWDCWR